MDLFGIYQGLKHVHLQTLAKVGFMMAWIMKFCTDWNFLILYFWDWIWVKVRTKLWALTLSKWSKHSIMGINEAPFYLLFCFYKTFTLFSLYLTLVLVLWHWTFVESTYYTVLLVFYCFRIGLKLFWTLGLSVDMCHPLQRWARKK